MMRRSGVVRASCCGLAATPSSTSRRAGVLRAGRADGHLGHATAPLSMTRRAGAVRAGCADGRRGDAATSSSMMRRSGVVRASGWDPAATPRPRPVVLLLCVLAVLMIIRVSLQLHRVQPVVLVFCVLAVLMAFGSRCYSTGHDPSCWYFVVLAVLVAFEVLPPPLPTFCGLVMRMAVEVSLLPV
ncbi:hypothetical protein DVH05_014680 [Phytophthora capsici]|nr:hypothetical protein DVH05_014680 [Phytophthora capsici]